MTAVCALLLLEHDCEVDLAGGDDVHGAVNDSVILDIVILSVNVTPMASTTDVSTSVLPSHTADPRPRAVGLERHVLAVGRVFAGRDLSALVALLIFHDDQ